MAGVPYVIGTWYPVNDRVGPRVAEEFYKHCQDPETGLVDASRSARALHETMSILRDQGYRPLVWGAYSHFGL